METIGPRSPIAAGSTLEHARAWISHVGTLELGVVTGPAIAIPGLVETLSEALRLPLEARVVEHGDDTENAGRLTVAAGLAVAERP